MTDPLGSHVVFAAGAGLATFLSPCALPLVPGYVGFYASAADDGGNTAGIVTRGFAAAAGLLVTLGTLAGLAILVGRPVALVLPVLEPVVGVALVVFGVLLLTERGPAPTVALPERGANSSGFALFGAGYAGASAACVLPVFLAVVVQAVSLSLPRVAAVVSVYALGAALPLLAVTVAVGLGLDVATARLAALGDRLERLAGVVLVLAGAGQVVVAFVPNAVPSLPVPL
ncbi:cytochrome c biogenesis protein CcdA [Haloarchaeobius litoreus]|uniref:Cytochrome c biogenesis protein CcdA n=1 Tax=Haloarchaeobius litoreus TaxID=755306 RepID=A0ABD6DNP0_9EURY